MTISQLIELLQDAADRVGEDAPVHLATQPHHPLAYQLAGIHVPEGENEVWLVEGSHNQDPYAVPMYAFDDVHTY